MDGAQKKTLVTILLTLAGALVLGLAGTIVLAYSGALDVAATSPPSALTRWLLETTREHSIDVRARGIEVPSLDDARMLAVGADHYEEMCVGCHGAPGIDPDEAAQGLEPPPPKLAEGPAMTSAQAAQTFWVVKHGIQMTGMPAFGKTHDDAKIWALVAFAKRLRDMSPQAYRDATRAEAGGAAESGEHHGHPAGAEHHHHEHHEGEEGRPDE